MSIVETYQKTAEQLEASRKQLLKEISELGDNRLIFVGREDDVIVAMIQIILKNADNDPDYANGKEIAHVHNLQVRNDRQGEGFGCDMMDFIEDKAREMGKRILTLGVDGVNERAINLYKRLGYEVFKEGPGQFPGETGYSMRKKL
jgi:ribosomal protein S18 acetylase RimI-like enzyme